MRLGRFTGFRKRRAPRLHDEIQFHRDRMIEDYVADGLTRGEAERRVFLEFGGVPQIEEAVRDVRGRWLEDLAMDLRYAFRTLGRNPGFSVVAVLLLALGIGANGAIFSLINAVMLRTLPVKEPEPPGADRAHLRGAAGRRVVSAVRALPGSRAVRLRRVRALEHRRGDRDRR